MLELLDQMDMEESTVQWDLLHLDPTDPDVGCCEQHSHGPEQPET